MRIIIILLMTVACNQNALKASLDTKDLANIDSNPKSDAAQTKSDDPKKNSDDAKNSSNEELANPPVMISGGFLYCVDLLADQKLKSNAYVGCRLNDSSGRRIDSRDFAKALFFELSTPVDVTASIRHDTNHRTMYDVFFDIKSRSDLSLKDLFKKTLLSVELREFHDGRPDLKVTSPLTAVLFDAEDPTRLNTWTEHCNASGCQFLESITGLVWLPFYTLNQTYLSAVASCNATSVADTVYRLPTASEMFFARATLFSKGSFNSNFAVRNENIWTSDQFAEAAGERPSRVTINPLGLPSQSQNLDEDAGAGYTCLTTQ